MVRLTIFMCITKACFGFWVKDAKISSKKRKSTFFNKPDNTESIIKYIAQKIIIIAPLVNQTPNNKQNEKTLKKK